MDTQAFRRSLHHSDRYNRRGFDSPTKRAQALEEAYQSDLISSIRDNGFTYTKGRLNIKLAQAFGFCWGVERAVAMAYETRRHYPNENIWIMSSGFISHCNSSFNSPTETEGLGQLYI